MKFFVLVFLLAPFLCGADFKKVSTPFLSKISKFSAPKTPPPRGAKSLLFDSFGNYYCLDSTSRKILILSPGHKVWSELPVDLPLDTKWDDIHEDDFGYLWLVNSSNIYRLYPRDVKAGWEDFSFIIRDKPINCSAIGPHGSLMLANASEVILITKRMDDKKATTKSYEIAAEAKSLFTDINGNICVNTSDGVYRKEADEKAWQKHWEVVKLLPCGNHDLSGDVLNGVFYTAGGLTNGYGFPAVSKTFDKLFSYDPRSNTVDTTSLGYDRIYCSVSHLDDKVWIINGDVKTGKTRHATSTVQVYDSVTKEVSKGPPTWIARPMPIALHANGRIYVAGNPYKHYEKPGQLESIGLGEKQWRREPDGPTNFQALAGTVLDNKIYLVVPKLGLAIFDTKTSTWTSVKMKNSPRSCQMAAYKGKIWMMGGRDTRNSSVQIYDPKTAQFTAGPDLPRNISWGAGVNINGKLYIFGGAESNRTYSNRIYKLRD